MNRTQDHRERVLFGVAKELQNWIVMIRKMKAIYHTLNMFNNDVSKKCMIGECWVPNVHLIRVQDVLKAQSVIKLYKNMLNVATNYNFIRILLEVLSDL